MDEIGTCRHHGTLQQNQATTEPHDEQRCSEYLQVVLRILQWVIILHTMDDGNTDESQNKDDAIAITQAKTKERLGLSSPRLMFLLYI